MCKDYKCKGQIYKTILHLNVFNILVSCGLQRLGWK